LPLQHPVPGLVIGYAYLWRAEAERGQDEGLKDRPCVIVLAVDAAKDGPVGTVAPITHTRPATSSHGIEIPVATKRRLGLDDSRSWIVTTEINRFVWPGPDLRPVSRARSDTFIFGLLPAALFIRVKASLIENIRAGVAKPVPRSE
jgi:hypothetical protein